MNPSRLTALAKALDRLRAEREQLIQPEPLRFALLDFAAAALVALEDQPDVHEWQCHTIHHPQNTTVLNPPCNCWQRFRHLALAAAEPLALAADEAVRVRLRALAAPEAGE